MSAYPETQIIDPPSDRATFVTVAVIAAIAAIPFYYALYLVYPLAVGDGNLLGPDSYMQIVRLREFIAAGDWHYNAIPRSNTPYGDISHWTKPFELVLLLLSAVFRPFMDVASSTHWAGIVVSPLLHVVLAIVLAWAATPLLREARLWVVPIALLNFPILQQAIPGRADHHVFLAIALAISAGFTIRAVLSLDERRPAVFAGIAQAFALWTSVEYAVLPVITMGFAAAWWILADDPARRRNVARQMRAFAIAIVATISVSLPIERPFAEMFAPELDRISVVYLLFLTLAGFVWLAMATADRVRWCWSPASRACAVVLTGAVAAGVMWKAFPGFFQGPYAGVSPLVEDFFLRHVNEVRSVFGLSPVRAIVWYGDALASVALLAWIVARRAQPSTMPGWHFYFALAASYTALALFQLRFATAAAVLSVLPFAYLVHAARHSISGKLGAVSAAAVRILATFLIIVGPGLAAAMIPSPSGTAAENALNYICPVRKIAPFLNALDRPSRIFAPNIYIGPALLFHTPHAVVGTPYHRNIAGIEDTYKIMSDTDGREARRLIEKRGIDLILICRKKNLERLLPAETLDRTLHMRLKRQSPPDWLTSVALPEALDTDFALYAVKRHR